MATKKFSWKEHKKWISEFADAKIIYPSEKNTLDVDINWKKNKKKKEEKEREELVNYAKKQNNKREKKNDTKSTNKNTKHNR